MSRSNFKFEVAVICGVTLLALVPMGVVLYSEFVKNHPAAAPGQNSSGPWVPGSPNHISGQEDTRPTPFPTVYSTPLPTPTATPVPRAFLTVAPRLSPDGKYAVAMPSLGTKLGTGGTEVRSSNELVVYRASDKKELSHTPLNTDSYGGMQWSADSNTLVMRSSGAQVWKTSALTGPTAISKGAGAPQAIGIYDGAQTSSVSSDGKALVNLLFTGGLKGYELPSGRSLPLQTQWKPTNGKPQMAVRPGTLGSLTAVLADEWDVPNPTPTPAPTAKPTPKPLTTAQKAFLKKEEGINEQISEMMGRIQGEEEISEATRFELIKRIKALTAQSKAERKLVFPDEDKLAHLQPYVEEVDYSQFEMRDLRSGATRWKQRLVTGEEVPRPFFSPDGSALLLVGSVGKGGTGHEVEAGLHLLDLGTGRVKSTLKVNRFNLDDQDLQFYAASGPMLALADTNDKGQEVLRRIDLRTGREATPWRLEAFKKFGVRVHSGFSCDGHGQNFAFVTGEDMSLGWAVIPAAQLQAANDEFLAAQPKTTH